MELVMTPTFLDVFMAPVRDNGAIQAALIGLLALIVLDFAFGLLNACMKGEYSSKVMREGLGHKCTELGYVLVGIIADGLIFAGLDIGLSGPVLGFIIGWLCIMEIGSLLEIFAKINPKLQESPIGKVLASVKVVEGQHAAK